MIRSIQKIIKVGNSAAVTIPAKEMQQQDFHYGDQVRVSIEPLSSKITKEDVQMMKLAEKLIKRHQAALERLAAR